MFCPFSVITQLIILGEAFFILAVHDCVTRGRTAATNLSVRIISLTDNQLWQVKYRLSFIFKSLSCKSLSLHDKRLQNRSWFETMGRFSSVVLLSVLGKTSFHCLLPGSEKSWVWIWAVVVWSQSLSMCVWECEGLCPQFLRVLNWKL